MEEKKAHIRLLNAVLSFTGATEHGSKPEIRAAAIELKEAMEQSQKILYPPELEMLLTTKCG